MAERRPGSDRGRSLIDWAAAFTYFASLPAEARSYAAVAAEFGVSVRTVERHGQTEGWAARLREIEAAAAREADQLLAHERAEQTLKLRKLIEATFIGYADKLRRGDVRMNPADLDRLHKLWRQLDDELEHQHHPPPTHEEEAPRSPEHINAVLEALADAGSLEALGLRKIAKETT